MAYFLAVLGNISFASASLFFAHYSKQVSAYWMNAFKTVVTWGLLVFVFLYLSPPLPAVEPLLLLMSSGFLGLNLGDLFLLLAFIRLGSSRTLMIFGFQPLLMGVASFFLFNQEIGPYRFISLIFLIGCLFFYSLEKYRAEGHWESKGLFFALIGMSLDTVGVLLTRYAFDMASTISPLEGHFYRCSGALIGFALMHAFWKRIDLRAHFLKWNVRERSLIVAASLLGTFFSLWFYLTAVRIGHLASLSAIAVTGPLFASLLEHWWKKELPSRYSLAATACFLIGFAILVLL